MNKQVEAFYTSASLFFVYGTRGGVVLLDLCCGNVFGHVSIVSYILCDELEYIYFELTLDDYAVY